MQKRVRLCFDSRKCRRRKRGVSKKDIKEKFSGCKYQDACRDLFSGKASVQTAIYLFEAGKPHNQDNLVTFVDFSEDGYTRMNRRKSGQDVNLRDTDDAKRAVCRAGCSNLKQKLLRPTSPRPMANSSETLFP